MSDRLTISAFFAVAAMALFAAFGPHTQSGSVTSGEGLFSVEAVAPVSAFSFGKLLPTLR